MVKLSILDLVSVSTGQPVEEAIRASIDAARRVDALGYERLWFAEHHNTAAVASSATAVLIGQVAAATEKIVVGSGGVMLPNHSPLTVVENFGTLAQLYPGRIELGLGRAPGTDQITARMLARSGAEPQDFMDNIMRMQAWFDQGRSDGIEVGVARGTKVPIWMLGSSTAGAAMAAALGLPYSFAAHFAPDAMEEAIHLYRSRFNPDAPTAQISEPYVSVGVNVLAHEDAGEAEHQFSTVQKMFTALRRTGGRMALQPPGALPSDISSVEFQMMEHMLRVRAVGTPDQVAEDLEAIAEQTGADELITVTYAFDPEVRTRSLELVAAACLS